MVYVEVIALSLPPTQQAFVSLRGPGYVKDYRVHPRPPREAMAVSNCNIFRNHPIDQRWEQKSSCSASFVASGTGRSDGLAEPSVNSDVMSST
jgi:hypothetical protein